MKNRKNITDRIGRKRHQKNLKRKKKKLRKLRSLRNAHDLYKNVIEVKDSFLSETLVFLKNSTNTELLQPDFYSSEDFNRKKVFIVPKVFSLVESPNPTYRFIKDVINSIYHNKVVQLELDYRNAKTVHIGAQLVLDILLREMFNYAKDLSKKGSHLSSLSSVSAININNVDIRKMLYSIGSFAIHRNMARNFPDIIPYRLCEFKKSSLTGDVLFNIEKKEKDVTQMVDYVISSLARMNKELTSDSIEDLSIIIGEILINAEEHSQFNHRYSIGYFQEFGKDGDKFGIFNLAILNFGWTIYDKFKDPDCPRPDIVEQMLDLSEKYTKKKLFSSDIKEETLWTLYALQEEVTSVSKVKNEKRGNGSIKFIESFFNLKGDKKVDRISRLALLSGNTSIVFDGTYGVQSVVKQGESFKVMTFNDTHDISDKPSAKYVKYVPNYFPGTIITAQILINKDDLK